MRLFIFIMFSIKTNGFNLKNTFENGQCFRFEEKYGGYAGVAMGEYIMLCEHDGVLTVDGVDEDVFNKKFVPYFDLDRDYKKITDSFPKEENLQKAVEYGAGMKILQQEPWEATVSFIISQNNNISRIKAIIKRLSENYGTSINGAYFAFPTAEELKDVKAADYARLGCGYRADYLEETVKKMLDNKIDFDFLTSCGYAEARETLLKLKGIGPKVADCICLFGLNYLDAFPVDTWIKKVMESLFLKRSATNREIGEYAKNAFGEYAGLAQQYLFYYARENKIKGLE